MSAHIAAMVLDRGGLSSDEKFVLMLLGDNSDDEGELQLPPAARLGADCGLPAQTVERIYDRFKADGLLRCQGAARYPVFVQIDLEALCRLPANPPRRRKP